MVVPIANLSAIVTGAMDAAKAVATEMLPAAVTRDVVVEATRASAAWFMHHLWSWLALARAVAVDSLPAGAAAAARSAAGSAVEASGPWVQTASKLLHGLYGWLVTAAVEKLPDVAAEKLLGDAAAWFMRGHGVAVYVTLALVLGGAVCALTCRTMKGPGLGGARVPRAGFEASPRRYYATVRRARKARRGAGCGLLRTGLVIAFVAYLAAKDAYVSGQSDDQLMNKARAMYKSERNQFFNLVYLWRLVHNQPKWTRSYVEEGDNNTDNNDTLERDIAEEKRPPGTKATKAKVKGKGVQLQVSRHKVEAAKARERAAIAKNEKAIMDKYTELFMADTTCFTDSQRT